jgi:NO-binding membrane sensor protein with MHYT domain
LLDFSHDPRMVAASLAVALMAGFTGLSLTRGASKLPVGQRKLVVSMAAVALGGGIWSMHFVAMLGLRLPILYYYDALITLVSALVAILITGVALLILHFRRRTTATITLAGAVVGAGIPVMHYIGMSGMELCAPVYTPAGVGLALIASLVLSTGAMRLAYSERGRRNIVLGTLGFGLAVFSVHFLAMAGTGFVAQAGAAARGALLGNQSLAIVVTLSVFVISGAFLLTGATFAPAEGAPDPAGAAVADPPPELRPEDQAAAAAAPTAGEPRPARLPFEKEGRTYFAPAEAVAAVRAEGHYTVLYKGGEKLFCPWSISEAARRLEGTGFLRVHRSYLVNARLVSGFERTKDTGACFVGAGDTPLKVPVSRSHIQDVRLALGL